MEPNGTALRLRTMTVWIDAGRITQIAADYHEHATSLHRAADQLRVERFGRWGDDPEIATFGTAFAALAVGAADELDTYASATHGLGVGLSSGSARIVDADVNWNR